MRVGEECLLSNPFILFVYGPRGCGACVVLRCTVLCLVGLVNGIQAGLGRLHLAMSQDQIRNKELRCDSLCALPLHFHARPAILRHPDDLYS